VPKNRILNDFSALLPMVEEGGFEPPKLVATDLQSKNYRTFIGDSCLFITI